jgi:homocysteine S-methyltransferase
LVKKIAQRVPSINIVVYPNSGEIYNTRQKSWLGDNSTLDFRKNAMQWKRAGARLIGGCCRTGPDHVSNLRKILLKSDTRGELEEY